MSKIFALLAVLLILTGIIVLAVPREDEESTRSLSVNPAVAPSLVMQVRNVAEQVNAPLSIVFGLVSLFYSRRSYHLNRARAEAAERKSA